VIQSLRAYQTLETHEKGKGWCLYIQTDDMLEVRWYWFKDLMSMFSFIITYPEGKLPKE